MLNRHEKNNKGIIRKNNLNKADFFGIAAEALPAAHKPILPDQPMRIAANTAANYKNVLNKHLIQVN